MLDRRVLIAIAILVIVALVTTFILIPNEEEGTLAEAERVAAEFNCKEISDLMPLCSKPHYNIMSREITKCADRQDRIAVIGTFGFPNSFLKRDQCSEVTF